MEDAVTIDADIVLLEGNYLLLDMEGWRELSEYAIYTLTGHEVPRYDDLNTTKGRGE